MKLFVYGTLKRGFYNNRLLGRSTFLTEGVGIGSLYILKSLPMLIKGYSGRVHGEIWEVAREDYNFIQYMEEGAGYYEGDIIVKIKDKLEFELCKVFYYDEFYFDRDRARRIFNYTLALDKLL